MYKAAPTGVHSSATGGSARRNSNRKRRTLGLATTLLLLFALVPTVGAAEPVGDADLQIVVPVNTVVRSAPGSEIDLRRVPTPDALIGATCEVSAQSENQSSVHPGNDLIVAGVVLSDVEASPGGVVNANEVVQLVEFIVISLIMGPDGVFSAGVTVTFECVPVGGSSTTTQATTSTSAQTTTTIGGTSMSTTTTSQQSTTSSVGGTTVTTDDSSTTTTAVSGTDVTSTTLETEVKGTQILPFTGPENDMAGPFGLALAAAGLLVVLAARVVTAAPLADAPVACSARCHSPARYQTPHGAMCRRHTGAALEADDDLWIPRRIVSENL